MKKLITYPELLSKILARSEDFISNPSLFKIRSFIEGYDFATKGCCPNREFYRGFNFWVAERYFVKTTHDWQSIISFEAGSEAEAIKLAKQLWHEYLETQALGASVQNCFIEAENLTSTKTSDLFEILQERPTLYIGHASVTGIRSFLAGYTFARQIAGIKEDDLLYTQFSSWTANRFNKAVSHQWDEIVSFMGISESGAFALMKDLWNEYKSGLG
jgi:hypothetical protein